MILAVTICWGPKYWDTFARTVLPNLAPQVEALGESVRWRIYATPADWSAWGHLVPRNVEFASLNVDAMGPLADGYRGMLDIFRTEIDYARLRGATLLFLPPDVVYADGSLARAWPAMQDHDSVVVPRIRVNSGPAEAHLRAGGSTEARQLATFALDNLHPLQESFFEDAIRFTTWPSNICKWTYRDGAERAMHAADTKPPTWLRSGMTLQGYHLFTLFARPQNARQDWENPDYDFVEKCCPNAWIPASSDEVLAVDLCAPGHLVSGDSAATNLIGAGPLDPMKVQAWVEGHTTKFHVEQFQHEYSVIAR